MYARTGHLHIEVIMRIRKMIGLQIKAIRRFGLSCENLMSLEMLYEPLHRPFLCFVCRINLSNNKQKSSSLVLTPKFKHKLIHPSSKWLKQVSPIVVPVVPSHPPIQLASAGKAAIHNEQVIQRFCIRRVLHMNPDFTCSDSYERFTDITYPVAVVRGDSTVKGFVTFEQSSEDSPTTVSWDISGNDANAERGMHVHVYGDNTNGCTSAGGHCELLSRQTGVRV